MKWAFSTYFVTQISDLENRSRKTAFTKIIQTVLTEGIHLAIFVHITEHTAIHTTERLNHTDYGGVQYYVTLTLF